MGGKSTKRAFLDKLEQQSNDRKSRKHAVLEKCGPQSNGRKSRKCHFWTNEGMRVMAESPENAGMAGGAGLAGLGWAGWLAGWPPKP